mmetsp:Transcript_19363/g.34499  ORF Transcript_19363/g.34499 Transcript_19363/m.34499 type:complete len:232 (-) Transcript_19363:770-1465(-)
MACADFKSSSKPSSSSGIFASPDRAACRSSTLESFLARRKSFDSEVRRISGVSYSGIFSLKKRRGKRRTAMPGCVRPARPARCLAEAWEHQARLRLLSPCFASWVTSRWSPKSMTAVTSGRVRDDSAMLEANTTWHTPPRGGLKAAACSDRGTVECMTKTLYLPAAPELGGETSSEENKFERLPISARPGRNTSSVESGFARRGTSRKANSASPGFIAGLPLALLPSQASS